MVVGLIADTHGLLRPEALERLRGAEHIIHAGDIGAPWIVDALAEIAPVTAIRGNVDVDDWARAYPEETTIELGGRRLLVLHDRKRIARLPAEHGIDVVISGHSHRPLVETEDGVLYVNPGAAGPRRFRLPVTVARLELGGEAPRAEILPLPV